MSDGVYAGKNEKKKAKRREKSECIIFPSRIHLVPMSCSNGGKTYKT